MGIHIYCYGLFTTELVEMDCWEEGKVSSEWAGWEEVAEERLIRVARLFQEKSVMFLEFIVLSAEFGLCERMDLGMGQ